MAAPYNCMWLNSAMKDTGAIPCGPLNETASVLSCCVLGDSCLSHNICAYTHSLAGGSGYYTAGCSDGNVSNAALVSGVCSNRCSDIILPDIVYDSNSGLWRCCAFSSNGTRDCQNPTDESFVAPAPSNLITYWTAGAATSMATASQMQSAEPTSSSIGSLTGTPAISTTTNSKISSVPTLSGDSRLSTGAVAGIAVSSIIAGVALILVIVLLMRKRHLDQRFEERYDIVNPKTSRDQQQHHELSVVHVPELPEQPSDP